VRQIKACVTNTCKDIGSQDNKTPLRYTHKLASSTTDLKKVKTTLEDKVRRGEFTKEMLASDIEKIKLKIQTAFGDMFNEALGGRKADVAPQVILGNTPEARRARMIARMRRKVAEKKDLD
jgi:hypothetical protein